MEEIEARINRLGAEKDTNPSRNDEPSGAKMVARTQKVYARDVAVLSDFPPTRGDDVQLIYRFYQRYHPEVKISPRQFKDLLYATSFETIRRRRQEIINGRRCEECGATYKHQIKECAKCGMKTEGVPIYPELQPTERVRRKRTRNEQAIRHDHAKGLTLEDFANGGD